MLSCRSTPVGVPRSASFLAHIVADTGVGKEVDVEIWREGKKDTLRVTLGELEKVDVASFTKKQGRRKGRSEAIKELGLELAPFNKSLAKKFQAEEGSGRRGRHRRRERRRAQEKGLRPGTLVIEVNQEKGVFAGFEVRQDRRGAKSQPAFGPPAGRSGR